MAKPLSKTTPATQALARAGVAHSLARYDYDPEAGRVGLQAAEAMGVDPATVFKTLMALVDERPVAVLVPSDAEVSMKKLAALFAAKSARMMAPADAERLTGYKVGGISPFGQRRPVRAAIDETALLHDAIFLNGGQRGLQIRLRPEDAIAALDARVADLLR